MKYLLTSGSVTSSIDVYVMDLIKMNLTIMSNDIPNSSIGSNFSLAGVHKDEIVTTVKIKLETIVDKIKSRFGGLINISIDSIEFLSESKVKVRITVNEVEIDEIELNI